MSGQITVMKQTQILLFVVAGYLISSSTVLAGCAPMDLALLLDESSSVGIKNWQLVLNFTKELVGSLDIGMRQTRVGLAKFGTAGSVVFHFDKYDCKDDLMNSLSGLQYVGGYTNTAAGLRTVRKGLYQNSGDRPDVPNIAFVFTDGKSVNKGHTRDEAILLTEASQCVICVAVGKNLDQKEVETIASDPDYDNLLMLDNFRDLLRSVGKVKTAICKYTEFCKEPLKIQNAITKGSQQHVGADVLITCKAGYMFLDGKTAKTIRCTTEGVWEPVGQCTDLGLSDWYISSRMNQNGATLAVDGKESTCMVSGYETNPWAALTFNRDLNVNTVDLSGRFHGDIQVRIGAQMEKKGHMVPPVMSTTLCQTLPPQKNGEVEGTLHCWKTGVGNTIYLIGNFDTADKMEICSLEINP